MSVTFALWILCVGQAAAPAPAPASPPPATGESKHVAKTRVDLQSQSTTTAAKRIVPSVALIGFLADYGDAADGLDPMGLAEHPDVKLNQDKAEHKP
ncbi:MAG: hypothetical protein ABI304_04725 [Rudaea sp.]